MPALACRAAASGGVKTLMSTRRQFIAAAAVLATTGFARRGWAQAPTQSWPQKPVRLLVGFAPGGNSDGIARLVGQRLGDRLGQPFVIENRAGANGTLAAETTARAPADGYTLFMAALPHLAIAPAMGKLTYDPIKDFAPISNIGTNPFVLVVHPSFPARTLPELVGHVRRTPGTIAYASGGNGSLTHLSMALFAKRAGLDMIHVPYKGGGPATADVIAGHVPVYFSNLSAVVPQVRDGLLRPLAVSDDKRHPQLPDVPTVIELGYPGFRTITWNGLVAPAATPKDIIGRLADEIAISAKDPTFIARLVSYGVDPLCDRPEQFAATIAADIPLWAEAVRISGTAAQ
jgi:tripartite-type tricarboxylate transporter receptor subunit TctC